MKLYGILGKGSGKLGNSVFSIDSGVQIMKEYNPEVKNPRTERQVAQRSKFKLMSQIAAALAPAIAIKREKLVSARNQFIGKNLELVEWNQDTASVALPNLSLTLGNSVCPVPTISAVGGNTIKVEYPNGFSAQFASVIAVCAKVEEQGGVSFVDAKTIPYSETALGMEAEFETGAGSFVVYVYGIKANEGNTDSVFYDTTGDTASYIASLIAGYGNSMLATRTTKTLGQSVTVTAG